MLSHLEQFHSFFSLLFFLVKDLFIITLLWKGYLIFLTKLQMCILWLQKRMELFLAMALI